MLKGFKYILYAHMMLFPLPGNIKAQEFQHTHSLNPQGRIRVSNVSGDIKVTGYDGDNISVTGTKEGPDRELVKIEETSSADQLELKVKYPKSGKCNASVHFEIRVPRSIVYNFDRVSSVSGNIEIDGIIGGFKAESVSGNVTVRNVNPMGAVSANSVSGNVNAEIPKLHDVAGIGAVMKFSTISGNIDVKASATLDATITILSVGGFKLKAEFPVEMRGKRVGSSQMAKAKLGSGLHSITLSTVSGFINLKRMQ